MAKVTNKYPAQIGLNVLSKSGDASIVTLDSGETRDLILADPSSAYTEHWISNGYIEVSGDGKDDKAARDAAAKRVAAPAPDGGDVMYGEMADKLKVQEDRIAELEASQRTNEDALSTRMIEMKTTHAAEIARLTEERDGFKSEAADLHGQLDRATAPPAPSSK